MNNQYEYFLSVAEDLNMSKVAAKKFVSHQCVSSYITSLEEKLGVKLFYRKPKLSLTTEGEILHNGLLRIKKLEENLLLSLSGTNPQRSGKLRVGMPSSYYNMIAPVLITEFKKLYPNVNLVINCDFSEVLETQTLNGELDLFIGTGKSESEKFVKELLFKEKLFVVMSYRTLRKFILDKNYSCTSDVFESGINLADFQDLPLILTPYPSRLRGMVDSIAKKNNYSLNIVSETNSPGMFIELCQNEMWASVIPELFIKAYTIGRDRALSDLLCFPLSNIDERHGDISISYIDGGYIPNYQYDFVDIVKKFFKNYDTACSQQSVS